MPASPAAVHPARDQKPVTLDVLVREWRAVDRSATPHLIHLGGLADRWIGLQARSCVGRPEAIRRLRESLARKGFRGELLNIARIVALYWVARLLGRADAEQLPTAVLRAFLPLVRRNTRTGLWSLRQELSIAAVELFALAAGQKLSAAAVSERVAALRPPRQAPPSRRKSTMALIRGRLADLSRDDLARLANEIQERLRHLPPASSPGGFAAA